MNSTTAVFLSNVTDADPRGLAVILDVLTDIEKGTYRYDDEVRKYAFIAGRLYPLDTSLRERVRLVAKRPIPIEGSQHVLLDFVAVLGALSLLTQLHDKDAVELNASRLTDPFLGQTAVEALRYLKSWEVTDEVERAFVAFQLRPQHDPVGLASYLVFLSESPKTSPSVCVGVMRSLSEMGPCCSKGLEAAIDLKARLGCPANGQ